MCFAIKTLDLVNVRYHEKTGKSSYIFIAVYILMIRNIQLYPVKQIYHPLIFKAFKFARVSNKFASN